MKRQLLYAITALGLLSGCAANKVDAPAPQLETGRLAVVVASYAPDKAYNLYAKGKGAAAGERAAQFAFQGAGAGAAGTLIVGVHVPLLLPFVPFIAPVAAVVGAVVGGTAGVVNGAWHGLPAEQAEAIHAPIERTLREGDLHASLAQCVVTRANDFPHYQLVPHAGPGPKDAEQAPDYRTLGAEGFRSVLELAVPSLGFEGSKSDPPEVRLQMSMRARIIPLAEEAPWLREHTHFAAWRPAAEWVGDDGTLLQKELGEACNALAEHLAQSIFSPAAAK